MRDTYELRELKNGAVSVRAVERGETFHPVVGPAVEAEALYVNQLNLRDRLANSRRPFVIWDVGLGAAANSVAVLKATADVASELEIISFDHNMDPLEFALRHTDRLPYLAGFLAPLTTLTRVGIADFQNGEQHVSWKTVLGDFTSFLKTDQTLGAPDVILFDPFSPARNPEMWTLPMFEALYRRLDPSKSCLWANYTRSTLVRVTLLIAGFFVGSGHPTGEKDQTTIASTRKEDIEELLDTKWLERVRRSTSAEPLHFPEYQQRPLEALTWERLRQHPQFAVES